MQPETLDQDRRAIEALNQHDRQASLAGDVDAIMSQWADDFIVINGGGPIVRGRAANVAIVEQSRAQIAAFDMREFDIRFEEIVVAGSYAFEWGTFRSVARPKAGGDDLTFSGKVMRILQRQANGEWKMHRTMTAPDPPVVP
jgi:ketosteroid isomerase-like protein